MDSWEKLPNEAHGLPFDVFAENKNNQLTKKFSAVSNINDHS